MHWKNCNRQECPVCCPLRNASDRRNMMGELNGSLYFFPYIIYSFFICCIIIIGDIQRSRQAEYCTFALRVQDNKT